MTITRRTFLRQTGAAAAVAAAAAAVPRPLLAQLGGSLEPVPPIDDPRLKTLTSRALDAARSAGAVYADVRLTHTRTRHFYRKSVDDAEDMVVGVRALMDGYWGFASGPVWSPDEMARLGREAVHQAKTNALGEARAVELAPAPPVHDGHWVMPVEQDPFALSPFEIEDFLQSLSIYIGRLGAGARRNLAIGIVQAHAFASTPGSYCTQRTYRTRGILEVAFTLKKEQKRGAFGLECLTPAGMGWELYTAGRIPQVREQSLREEIRQRLEEAKADLRLPVKPIDVGRYDAVFDPWSMALLVDQTLGRATELDRALGYEANAGGTSYLNDPFGMLGSYQAGAESLTLMGNRSQPGAAATVQWDDEGVTPAEFPLVKDGVLVDFQTTRESAGWLKDYYRKSGEPFRSHGCANAPSAVYAPMQHSPNLVLMPGHTAQDFDALVAGMSDGIAIKGTSLDMDFQHDSGLGAGRIYEVKHGKRVAQIAGAGYLFRATSFWKGLHALGGAASVRRYGRRAAKGEPAQWCYHSVSAPAAVVKELTLIDPLRKA